MCQILLAYSDKAYDTWGLLLYCEARLFQGRYLDDVGKSCADLIAAMYATSYGLPTVITRCGSFHGGGDLNWDRIVPGTVRSALAEQRAVIRSDGKTIRDYRHVEGAVNTYLMRAGALSKRRELADETFNLGHNAPIAVAEVDPSKAPTLARWQPWFTLRQWLDRTVNWYHELLGERS